MRHTIDAEKKPLGRLASEIAMYLQGKTSPSYSRNALGDANVIVKNVRKIAITGNKSLLKRYYRHTGYMGHLKSLTLAQVFERNPERVVREAVRGMLPKNSLNRKRLKHIVFEK